MKLLRERNDLILNKRARALFQQLIQMRPRPEAWNEGVPRFGIGQLQSRIEAHAFTATLARNHDLARLFFTLRQIPPDQNLLRPSGQVGQRVWIDSGNLQPAEFDLQIPQAGLRDLIQQLKGNLLRSLLAHDVAHRASSDTGHRFQNSRLETRPNRDGVERPHTLVTSEAFEAIRECLRVGVTCRYDPVADINDVRRVAQPLQHRRGHPVQVGPAQRNAFIQPSDRAGDSILSRFDRRIVEPIAIHVTGRKIEAIARTERRQDRRDELALLLPLLRVH